MNGESRHRNFLFLGLVTLLISTKSIRSIDPSEFLTYDDPISLNREDDTHSEQIILSPEMPFIATKYESLYVRKIELCQ